VPRAGGDYSGYVIETTLGRGGSATVYLARRISDGLRVALKVLDDEHRDTRQMAWLEHRYALLRQLDHPHIVRYVELGPYWAATRYVDGGNVTTVGRAERFTALTQIADALDYTHRKGIVHCDVKPANILLAAEGRVKVGDFGVARLAEGTSQAPSATVAGTPRYMSPEQSRGRPTTSATDVYSAGVVLYEMLAGEPPFARGSAVELGLRHIQDPPPPLPGRVPAALREVVQRALAKEPDERYRDGSEMAAALRSASSAGPQSPTAGATLTTSRHRADEAPSDSATTATVVKTEPATLTLAALIAGGTRPPA